MTLRMRRIAAGAAALAFLIGAGVLYRMEFVSLRTEGRRQEAAETYTKLSGLTVFGDETVRGRRVLAFADGRGTLGCVQFRRGLLGGWQAVGAGYSTGDIMRADRLRDVDALAVYAAACPPEIARYKVQANLENEETLMAEGEAAASGFLHIHETDRDYFPRIFFYGAAGDELDGSAYQKSAGGTGIGTAEINMVYVLCAVLLGVGWLIVKYLWDGGKPREKETA